MLVTAGPVTGSVKPMTKVSPVSIFPFGPLETDVTLGGALSTGAWLLNAVAVQAPLGVNVTCKPLTAVLLAGRPLSARLAPLPATVTEVTLPWLVPQKLVVLQDGSSEIGRASCRERGKISVGDVGLEKKRE